jgi:hypothetical protein
VFLSAPRAASDQITLKFGALLMALHYFKNMAMVRREKASWRGQDDRLDGPVVRPITVERRRMVTEAKNSEARRLEMHRISKRLVVGAATRKHRAGLLAAEVARKFLAEVKQGRDMRRSSVAFQKLCVEKKPTPGTTAHAQPNGMRLRMLRSS